MLVLFLLIATFVSIPAVAITEEEVQAQVDSVGREVVTGNVFIWFLCAIGFLKVAQKVDSYMASLGINVGHTGGSMLAEAMIAARGIGAAVKAVGGGSFSRVSHRGGNSASSNSTGNSFISSSLGSSIGHGVQNGAVKYATGQKSGGLPGVLYQHSLNKGGDFSNQVVSRVAQGSLNTDGVIKGGNASKALSNYMGYGSSPEAPKFKDIEIGGGRIGGTEISREHPEGVGFGMYNADQYMQPKGDFETVKTADGSKWYKQYAENTVQKTPRKNEMGEIAYDEKIVRRVPEPPKRKDRI